MTQARLLALGNLKGAALAALENACRHTGYEATILSRADDAIHELDRPLVRALVVDLTTPGAARFCQEARARRALFNVPLIALSPKLTDLAFSNAQRWGADDVVALGAMEPLRARLEFIPEITAPLASATRGEAVIADPDRGRCDVLGRVLANAGFNVKYATDPVATRFYLSKTNIRLFVLNTELNEPVQLISEARASGNHADWIVTTKTLGVEAAREELKALDRVIVMPSHGPPENVLFAINLLQPSSEAQRRTEVRALHAAIVQFSALGWSYDEHGFTYSVSAGGLYLRTLIRPPKERIWLELTPPNVPRKVRLLGEVAWSRTFGQPGAETAPAGFAVRIVEGQGDDLALWQQGFQSLEVKSNGAYGVPELRPSTTSFRIPLPSHPPGRGASLNPGRLSLGPQANALPRTSASSFARAGRSLSPGNVEGRPSAEVFIPSSTWSAPEYTPRGPNVSPPRPPTTSSQSAVLAALRTSLLPNAPSLPPIPGAPDMPGDLNDGVVRSLEPGPVFITDDTEPEHVVPDIPPIKLDPSALLDPDLDEAKADRPAMLSDAPRVVRTVLGVGHVEYPLGAFSAAPPPPMTLDQLESLAAPDPSQLEVAAPAQVSASSDDSAHAKTPNPLAATFPSATLSPEDQNRIDPAVTAQDERASDQRATMTKVDDKTDPQPTPAAADTGDEFLADRELTSIPPAPGEEKSNAGGLDRTLQSSSGTEAASSPKDTTRSSAATRAVGTAQSAAQTQGTAHAPGTGRDKPRLTEPPPRRTPRTRPSAADTPWQDQTAPATSGASLKAPPPPRANGGRGWLVAMGAVAAVLGGLLIYSQRTSTGKPKQHTDSPAALAGTSGPVPPQVVASKAPEVALVPAQTPALASNVNPVDSSAVAGIAGSQASAQPSAAAEPEPSASAASAPTLPAPQAPEASASSNVVEVAPVVEVAAPGEVPSAIPEAHPPSANIPPPPDEKLPEDSAWLYVRSNLDTRVFVHGVDHGTTNQWFKSRCGGRFIRLGSAPGVWQSPGIPAKLRCRQGNEIEINSTP
ncbi:MAG TPA: hypothetical protein VHM70_30610 [Polyangiaceae bacterium]|nr:hypothetical protein [Polyangiaceae bacterium]